MSTPPKADPSIYPRMRENVLRLRLKNCESGAVQIVLMDWHVPNGTASVLASADGTTSIYLSSGGGYLGGGQKHPQIRDAARRAVSIAGSLKEHFRKTEQFDLPPREAVAFYLVTDEGVFSAQAIEAEMRTGASALTPLGGAMQSIVTGYRLATAKT